MLPEVRREQSERRADKRFPIKLDIQYRALTSRLPRRFRRGRTINMSSHGILFSDDQTLTYGTKVEAEVDWPFKLDGEVPLKLVIHGSVVRLENRSVALAITRHEFRVCGSH
jgi:PilZ domain-containing protein